jgi:hypothetical protein
VTKVAGHKDLAKPLRDYCMVETGRKSVEAMAAVTAPERTNRKRLFLRLENI